MRTLYAVILAVFALLCNDALAAADQSELVEAELTKNEHKRFLRVGVVADDDPYAIEEERARPTGLSKLAKELKLRNQNLKKVSAALEKAKASPSKLAVTAKKMKASTEKTAAKLSSMETDNFMRLFKAKLTPTRAMSTGKIRNREQLANYEEFYKLAIGAGLK